MRIIAGRFRRRTLLTNPGLITRPITDRVKESLFENIEQRLIGRRIADVFAGTGTMGLESLSRGAERVVFVERDKVAVDLLRSNVDALGCQSETLIWPSDVLRCSFRPKGESAAAFLPYGVIFFDPPYKMVPRMKEGSPLWLAARRLARDDVSAPDATMIFRVPEHVEYDLPAEWTIDWSMEASGMIIHICNRAAGET